MRSSRASSCLAAVIVAAALAACFPPAVGEGKVRCGAGGSCPPSFVCRADNRCYTPSFPVPAIDLGGGAVGDLAGATAGDLAGSDASTDMSSIANVCSATVTRVCIDATHSATCVASGGSFQPVADRTCPPGSTCGGGHCQPPAGATGCLRNTDCTGGNVCIEYVQSGMVTGFCSMPIVKPMGGNTKCTTAGFDPKCPTGICAAVAGNTMVKACLNPCTSTADCNGNTCSLVGAPPALEGTSTSMVRFCEPN